MTRWTTLALTATLLAGCAKAAVRDDAPLPPAATEPAPAATEERPPVATDFELSEGKLVLPAPIAFETGSDRLLPESERPLWHVVDYLGEKTPVTLLRVEGHSDTSLEADAAQTLTEARALAVSRWLVAHGVDCKRLIPVGFGSNKPIAPNDIPENKAMNVRITFVNAALRGKAIGGMPVDGSGAVAGDPCQ